MPDQTSTTSIAPRNYDQIPGIKLSLARRKKAKLSDELELRVTDVDGTPVLVLQGEIDIATAPRLREELLVLDVSGHSHVIIDLDGVSFLDSTALGVLVSGLRRFRTAGGDLSLVCSQTWLLKLFEVTGLTNLINIHDDWAGAVSAMASSSREASPNS